MSTVLSIKNPVARKRHYCYWCTAEIKLGDTYQRTSIARNGGVYDWIDCNACAEDQILTLVSAYFDHMYGEGYDRDDAVEWAWEVIRNDLSPADDVMVAQRYLDRAGIDWRAEL